MRLFLIVIAAFTCAVPFGRTYAAGWTRLVAGMAKPDGTTKNTRIVAYGDENEVS